MNATRLTTIIGLVLLLFVQIQGEERNITNTWNRNLDELYDDAPEDPAVDDEYGVEGQYIVKFSDDVSNPGGKMKDLIAGYAGDGSTTISVVWEYTSALKGVTISGVTTNFLNMLAKDSEVLTFEQDVEFELDNDHENPWSWGLDRIDQLFDDINPEIKFDNRYHYDFTGIGVSVVVMDSGIQKNHLDFLGGSEDRVVCAFNAFGQDIGESCHDRLGHGTFIAGIIGGKLSGVAKKVDLVNVKVVRSADGFICAGSIIAGLDYVNSIKLEEPDLPIVLNLSFSGPKRNSINEIIKILVHNNIHVVTSAGNDSTDACNKSPGSAEKAITVGSTDYNDVVSEFSNFGTCIDIYAPGQAITSAWIRTDTDLVTLSGTSMAAAHVTGVIALMLEVFGDAKPIDIETNLKENAFQNVLKGNFDNGSPNLLVHAMDSNMEK